MSSSPLFPILIDVGLEQPTRTIKTNIGEAIYNRINQPLAYANDVVITNFRNCIMRRRPRQGWIDYVEDNGSRVAE